MRVLVAYDGSDCADAAVEDLGRAGLPETGQMHVLCIAEVWPPESVPVPGLPTGMDPWVLPALRDAREAQERELALAGRMAAEGAQRLRETFPKWEISEQVECDAPRAGIAKRADAWKPDLLVLGSHGRSALERFFLGSVSHAVLTHVGTSVRIGRRGSENKRGGARIVVGVDGSAGSAAAVAAVASRRWPADSAARVISVIDSIISTAIPMAGLAGGGRPAQYESSYDRISDSAKTAADRLREAGLHVAPQVCQGDPKKVLVDQAARWGADCIFVGARGRTRFERFLLGSVSLAVAGGAGCSVEVVRPAG